VHWSSEAEEEDFGSDEEFPDEEDKATAPEDELPTAESADEEGVRADDEEFPLLLSELKEEVASVELSHPTQKKAQRASRSLSHRDLDFLKKGFMDLNINSFKNLSVNFGKKDPFYGLHHEIYASK